MTTLRLPPLPTVRDIVKIYRLSAIKQLSQNFLLDQNITNRIAKYTGKIANSEVLEVGPGPGTITRSILRRTPSKLIVVEKDKRFKPSLSMLKEAFELCNGKLDIIYEDIMKVNTAKVFSEENKKDWEDICPKKFIVGNLPFNISTILIIKWLHEISEKRGAWEHGRVPMTLTFQKEVAERLVAEVSQQHRCRLSIMAQAWTKPKLRCIIPGKAFVPEPEVDVGVVTLEPLKIPRTKHEFKFFEKIARHMFSFKQKYSHKCAATLFPPEYSDSLPFLMFKIAEVDPNLKAIDLSVEDISRLGTAYKFICEKHPEVVGYNYRASRKVVSRDYTKSVQITDYDCEDLETDSTEVVYS